MAIRERRRERRLERRLERRRRRHYHHLRHAAIDRRAMVEA